MDNDDRSFRPDPTARSFRLAGFGWRDVPVMALGFGLVTALAFGLGAALEWLPRDVLLVLSGVCVGYFLGVWVGAGRGRGGRAEPGAAADRGGK